MRSCFVRKNQTKKIFVVGADLIVRPCQTTEEEWKRPLGLFGAMLEDRPILVSIGVFTQKADYAGFSDETAAKRFAQVMRKELCTPNCP